MEQLEQATAAIADGKDKEAQMLLAQILKADPQNVEAWVLLSQVAASPEQAQIFLERAARIDPTNEMVQERFAAMRTPPDEAPAPMEAPAVEATEEEAFDQVETEPVEAEPADLEQVVEEEAVFMMEEEEDTPDDLPVIPVSTDPMDFEAQAEGDTLPPWLEGEEEYLALGAATNGGNGEALAEDLAVKSDVDLPDWLREEPVELWDEDQPDAPEDEPVSEPSMVAEDIVKPLSKEDVAASKKRPEKKQKSSVQRSAILEWAIAGFAILLFLILIFILFGGALF